MKIQHLLLAGWLASGTALAADTVYQPKQYTCTDLRQLVSDKGTVVLQGFWNTSRRVHSQARKCDVNLDIYPQQSSWNTSDRRFCSVGYVCNQRFGRGTSR